MELPNVAHQRRAPWLYALCDGGIRLLQFTRDGDGRLRHCRDSGENCVSDPQCRRCPSRPAKYRKWRSQMARRLGPGRKEVSFAELAVDGLIGRSLFSPAANEPIAMARTPPMSPWTHKRRRGTHRLCRGGRCWPYHQYPRRCTVRPWARSYKGWGELCWSTSSMMRAVNCSLPHSQTTFLPTADDFPNIRVFALENYPAPHNPLGAKGAGEAVSFRSAVSSQTLSRRRSNPSGCSPNALPLSPPRLWQLIQDGTANPKG